MKRDFLRVLDLSSKELDSIIKRALSLKDGTDKNKCPLMGKSIGLIFEKSSTRTRVSFEVGIYQLGAQAVVMNSKDIQLGRGETIGDTAKTLSRYLDGIIIRTFGQDKVEDLALGSDIPVINALSDTHHPCQAVSDVMTIRQHKGKLKGLKLAFVGDGNNVANSLIEAASRTGMILHVATPKGCEPDSDILSEALLDATSEIVVHNDPERAVKDADVVYTDVWISMGQEEIATNKLKKFKGFQINEKLLSLAKPSASVMHCLPAKRGMEITDGVIDGPRSIVFDQAENRLHAQKALLERILS